MKNLTNRFAASLGPVVFLSALLLFSACSSEPVAPGGVTEEEADLATDIGGSDAESGARTDVKAALEGYAEKDPAAAVEGMPGEPEFEAPTKPGDKDPEE